MSARINITRIEVINGEKILSLDVNRIIRKNQLDRYRRLIKFIQSKRLNKSVDVVFTYRQLVG